MFVFLSIIISLSQANAKLSFYDQELDKIIKIRAENCNYYLPSSPNDYALCKKELDTYIKGLQTCETNSLRIAEVKENSKKSIEDILARSKLVAIPFAIQQYFNLLVDAAKKTYPNLEHINIKLTGYIADEANASATPYGDIIITSQLLFGELNLTNLEIAAILAHEISHIGKNHGLISACHALAWAGGNTTIADAAETMRTDMNPNQGAGLSSINLSQKHEYEADANAVLLLNKAGFDPYLMSQALNKLLKLGNSIYQSHPETEDRIKKAFEAARFSSTIAP